MWNTESPKSPAHNLLCPSYEFLTFIRLRGGTCAGITFIAQAFRILIISAILFLTHSF